MKKKLSLLLVALMVATCFAGCGKFELADSEFALELGDKPENHTSSYVEVKNEKELAKVDFDFSDVDNMKVGECEASATYKKSLVDFL